VGDALHARLVAREAFGAAVAQETNEPSPLMGMRLGRKTNGAWRVNSQRKMFAGIPGAAHGPAKPGQMPPALAKLVSRAGPLRRSTTSTSWPDLER